MNIKKKILISQIIEILFCEQPKPKWNRAETENQFQNYNDNVEKQIVYLVQGVEFKLPGTFNLSGRKISLLAVYEIIIRRYH